MSSLNDTKRILNATSGDSAELKSIDNILTYKFTISGTPSANIIIDVNEQLPNKPIFFIQASCTNWNGASVELFAKTTYAGDTFTSTGPNDIITQDLLTSFDYTK